MNQFKPLAIRVFLPLALLMVLGQNSQADDPQPASAKADQPQIVDLTLHPAELPYRALQYRLLPKGIELTPGNAAPHYFRAALVWANDKAFQDVEAESSPGAESKLIQWLKLPLDQLAKNEEAQKFFNERPTGQWDLIDLAARREQCEWDLPTRELNISTPIPELRKLRDMGRLLAFKARIEISRGQFDQALKTLDTGMAMARHAAHAPTLINAMLGANLVNLMLAQVETMIQQPKCPNLYWALTALPDPVVNLNDALEFEGSFLYLFLPELRDVRTAVHTDAEWDKILLQVADKLMKVRPGGRDQKKDLGWYGMGALFAVSAYPKAKQQLQEAGYSPAQIKDMCVSQAILTAEVETFDHLSNDTFKWFYVDTPTALQGLAQADQNLEAFNKTHQEIIPLAALVVPTLKKTRTVEVETARYVAALRVVEAMRLYAAGHHNELPQHLSDIKEVPIPNDPFTGQPFMYDLENGCAVLASSPSDNLNVQPMRWRIQLASGKK